VRRAALLAGLAACSVQTGTIAVSLVTAPGSHVLDPATRGKLVLSDPPAEVDAARGADGSFALDLDVDASGASGTLTFEAQDDSGAVVAWGATPPLPVSAINVAVAIYVAAPMSLAPAPVTLATARADLAIAPIVYGAVIAGGADSTGAPGDELDIYDVYDHMLQAGLALPAPRAAMTAIADPSGLVYLFGGDDATGAATSTFWRFDTGVAPAGAYADLSSGSKPAWARSGASAAGLGGGLYVIGGAPPLVIDATPSLVATTNLPASLGGLAATGGPAGDHAVFVGTGAGTNGVGVVSQDGYIDVGAPADAARTGHGVTALPDGTVLAIGGADASGALATAVKVDPIARGATPIADALAVPRTGAAVAAAGALVVVAGGTDASGTVRGDAEVYDTASMKRVTTIPAVARTGAQAIALPNGEVLVAGGRDASGAPVATLELFTPPAP
jgi:hypothetical protein